MILVLEKIITDNSKEKLSILSLKPDAFTEIRFLEDEMHINSKTSFDTYLSYRYSDWAIKYFLDVYNDKGNITYYDKYLKEELTERFEILDVEEKFKEPKPKIKEEKLEEHESKTINEDLGILGN